MTSTFHTLETGRRALLVNAVYTQTLGQNVANANTDGYSRQRVNTSATTPIWAMGFSKSQAPGQIGTGVQYDSITRVRDTYLDTQYRRENQNLGSWDIVNTTLGSLQDIINEPSNNGIRGVMDSFWNSWEALNRDPSLLSARVAVSGAGVNFTDTLQNMSDAMTNLTNDTNSSISKKVDEANNLINNIAQLNSIIHKNESLGDHANDFRDQRDLLIDKLSSIVDVQVSETDNMVTISSAGVTVVNGETVTALTTANAQTATAGQLNGYTQSLKEIDNLGNQLNAMVSTLVTGPTTVQLPNGYVAPNDMTALNDVTLSDGTVITAGTTIPKGSEIASPVQIQVNGFNGLHELGYGLNNPPTAGIPFFVTKDGTNNFAIDNIQVNPDIVKDTNNIAASSKYDTATNATIRGNSDVANALASMRDTIFKYPANLTSLSEGTTDDYFRALTGDLGVRASNAERNFNNEQDLVDSYNMRRQSVSGVSLDEEMSDMLKFQHAYNAAARLMTTFDEMLDRVINQTGRVGL